MDKKGFDFVRIIKCLDELCELIMNLHSFKVENDKTILIREFVQKSNSLLKAQSLLLVNFQVAECAILYRTHLERYIYLLEIVERNEYSDFTKWSDSKQIKLLEKMISEQRKNDISIPALKVKNLNKKIDKHPKWDAFKIENYFKSFNLKNAYIQHFDMASSFVHTRVNQDNNTILKIKETSDFYKINPWILIECAIQLHMEILLISLSECYNDIHSLIEFFFTQVERYIAGEIDFNSFESKYKSIIMHLNL